MRVALADDAVLLRAGLKQLLSAHGHEVVVEAGDAEALLDGVREHGADVAVTDIRMPPGHSDEGLRAAEELAALDPGIGVLVLSQYVEPAYALRLLEQDVPGRGYLLKERVPTIEAFLGALDTVAAGGSYVDTAVVEQLVGRSPLAELTPRERDILALMAEGRSNGGICARRHLAPKTVEAYVRSIFMKLGLEQAGDDHRRVLAVLRFLGQA